MADPRAVPKDVAPHPGICSSALSQAGLAAILAACIPSIARPGRMLMADRRRLTLAGLRLGVGWSSGGD
jgi:hypothetical protein